MIYTFEIPTKHLNSKLFFVENGWNLYILNNQLCIAGDCTKEQAQAALNAHNPPAPSEMTIEQKLANIGVNLNDLKTLLGL